MNLQNTRLTAIISLNRTSCAVGLLILAITLLGVSGCASVSPAPFNALTSSIQQLRDGADASLGIVYQRSFDRYLEESSAGDASKVHALLLTQPSGDPFGWAWATPDPPLFFTTAHFRTGVYQLNSVLAEYSGLLEQLASPDLLDPETFEKLAGDPNGNLMTAAMSLGASASPEKEMAIFSTSATGAFRAYLQNRQRSALLEALSRNQSAIEEAAELGASAVRITSRALRNEYDLRSSNLAMKAATPALSVSARQSAIRDLIDADDKFIKEISLLRTLHDTYRALPAAHRDLAAGLSNPGSGLPMIQNLYDSGHELSRFHKELIREEKGKSGKSES